MNNKKSVLVVDDEPNGFDLIEAHLYREGYQLIYAPSGIEALNCLNTLMPDVILLDVMMPEMDGMEVCRKIKSTPHWQHIPIVMVTALSSKEDLARSLDAGADDFLSKPISGVELRARVRSMLRIKQQYDTLQTMLSLREDLSSMIVHDLRNPLTKILVSSNFLNESNLDEDDRQSLQLIASAGRQLNSMINDLLIQAKMESGKMILHCVEVDLNHLVREALSEFESVAATKNLQVKSHFLFPSLPISIDANLIRRVIDNLLSNAHKFSPKGGTITLNIKHLQTEQAVDKSEMGNIKPQGQRLLINPYPSKRAIIQIADEGVGIQEDLKQRIFEKYEVGKFMPGVTQLGLGLAFCKMVIEAHNGTIIVEDNHPKGTIFTVIL
jgi:signal transduction histidine kinase